MSNVKLQPLCLNIRWWRVEIKYKTMTQAFGSAFNNQFAPKEALPGDPGYEEGRKWRIINTPQKQFKEEDFKRYFETDMWN